MTCVTSTIVTPPSRTLSISAQGVATRLWVQPGGELVDDRDLRVADKCERDRQPLLLSPERDANLASALSESPSSALSLSGSAGSP
jgi:hypothetical protein